MKALTIWQPWATLIAVGAKSHEFRSWRPPAAVVGQRIAIHAGKRPVPVDEINSLIANLQAAYSHGETQHHAVDVYKGLRLLELVIPSSYARSSIVATAVVGDSIKMGDMWAWPMLDVRLIPLVPISGGQGLWNWNEEQL